MTQLDDGHECLDKARLVHGVSFDREPVMWAQYGFCVYGGLKSHNSSVDDAHPAEDAIYVIR